MNANVQGHLDYSHSYSPVNLATPSTYPYITGTGNSYPPYSQQVGNVTTHINNTNTTVGGQNVSAIEEQDIKPIFMENDTSSLVSFPTHKSGEISSIFKVN